MGVRLNKETLMTQREMSGQRDGAAKNIHVLEQAPPGSRRDVPRSACATVGRPGSSVYLTG